MRNGGARRLKSKVSFILGCPFQDPSHPAFQTASPSYFSYSSEHRVLLHIRHRDQNRLSRKETHIISVLRTGETGSCGKNILRDLSSTTVKSCGKGRNRITFSSSGHSCLNCEIAHLLLQPSSLSLHTFQKWSNLLQSEVLFTVTQFIRKEASSPAWPQGRWSCCCCFKFLSTQTPSHSLVSSFIPTLQITGEPAQDIKPKWKYTLLFSGLFFHQIIALKRVHWGVPGRLCLHKERLGLPGLHEEQDHSNTGLDSFKWFDIVYWGCRSCCKPVLLLVLSPSLPMASHSR